MLLDLPPFLWCAICPIVVCVFVSGNAVKSNLIKTLSIFGSNLILAGILMAPPSLAQAISPEAVAAAQYLGLPAITPGSGVAGPFEGPEGSLFYVDQAGRLTFLLPDFSVYLAHLTKAGSLVFDYGMTPLAMYQFAGGQGIQLANPTPEMSLWPFVEPMAGVLLVVATQYQAGLQSGSVDSGSQVEAMSAISGSLHQTSMSILDNIGGSGCTEHYEGVYYIGCW